MTYNDKKIEFAVFCIEEVAKRLNELPENVYRKLECSGLMDDFIIGCYDALHTESREHIVDDIIEALRNRRKEGLHAKSIPWLYVVRE